MKQYFPQLTGFRFVAAIMVYFSHINPLVGTGIYAEKYFSEMQAGVGLFFVLSGFLISSRYFDSIQLSKKWIWNFFVNRFARIYPVYFVLTTFTLLYASVVNGRFFDKLEYLLNITFLKGYSACYHSSGIMQGWSLTVEETFYALSPLLLLLLKRRLKISTLFLFYLLFTGIVFCMISIHNSSANICLFFPFADGMIYTFFGRSLDFLSGMFLAMVLLGKFSLPNFSNQFKLTYTTLGALLIAISIGVVAYLREEGNPHSGLHDVRGILANNVFLPFAVMLFLYGLITENSWVKTALSWNWIEALGKSSYVFYLIHVGIFRNLLKEISSFEPLLLLMSLALAHVIYLLIEHPFNDFIRRKLART